MAPDGPTGETPSELIDVVFGNEHQNAIMCLCLHGHLKPSAPTAAAENCADQGVCPGQVVSEGDLNAAVFG